MVFVSRARVRVLRCQDGIGECCFFLVYFDAAIADLDEALWRADVAANGEDGLDAGTETASLFFKWNVNVCAAGIGEELTPLRRA